MIKNDNINLNFHSTFSPDFDYITKILEIADDCEGLTKEEISEITGIPTGKSSGKVEPHIMYSKYMNLIEFEKNNGRYKIYTTDLGKVIKEEDLYFLEYISKLVCNYFLTSKTGGATLWNLIFRDMPQKCGDNIKESLILREIEEGFNCTTRISAFKSCYKNQKSLASLNLIYFDENSDKSNNIKFNKNIYDEDSIYVYAYTLIKDLERLDKDRKEFTIDEIIEKIAWNRGFCWDEKLTLMVFEKLNDMNIITLNRQLNPITLIINKSSESIVNELYSLIL